MGRDGKSTEELKKATTIAITTLTMAVTFEIGSPKGSRTPDSSNSVDTSNCNGYRDCCDNLAPIYHFSIAMASNCSDLFTRV